MKERPRHDPLARIGMPADDAPLFGPTRPLFESRDVTPPAKRGHRPMAEESIHAFRSRDRATDRLRVLRMIVERPQSLDEIAATIGAAPNALSGRLTELSAAELIERTGERRPTRSGSTAAVWRATAVGVAAASKGAS